MAAGLLLNLIANAIWAVLAFVGLRLLRSLERGDPRHRRRLVIAMPLAIYVVMAAALWWLHVLDLDPAWGWLLVAFASLWSVWALVGELNHFWKVGVFGADSSVASGLSYEPALRLVKNELSFLGTGAHKLSQNSEFEKALRRCRDDVPIRLLLRRPTDTTLRQAAKRASHPEEEYAKNVVESLHTISRLQSSIGNIEVRFYEGELVFRIMIIDRKIALVSYNVYGRGDGSELPQLHLVDVSDKQGTTTSFFHAYEKYFNDRWASAEPWDFVEHL